MTEVIEFRSRTGETRARVNAAVFKATQEVFELDVKPQAVEDSPKLTGTNARSIDTTVMQTDEGCEASIFTQSGYGAYLELGTRKMKPQPYIYPAWEKFRDKIPKLIRSLLSK